MKKQSKDVDDDSNDFNDDYSLIDAFSKSEAEGNISDQARVVNRHIPGGIQGTASLLFEDDDDDSYGYGSYRGNFILYAFHFILTLKHPSLLHIF